MRQLPLHEHHTGRQDPAVPVQHCRRRAPGAAAAARPAAGAARGAEGVQAGQAAVQDVHERDQDRGDGAGDDQGDREGARWVAGGRGERVEREGLRLEEDHVSAEAHGFQR